MGTADLWNQGDPPWNSNVGILLARAGVSEGTSCCQRSCSRQRGKGRNTWPLPSSNLHPYLLAVSSWQLKQKAGRAFCKCQIHCYIGQSHGITKYETVRNKHWQIREGITLRTGRVCQPRHNFPHSNTPRLPLHALEWLPLLTSPPQPWFSHVIWRGIKGPITWSHFLSMVIGQRMDMWPSWTNQNLPQDFSYGCW
jgi:hypothetical protein